MSGTGMRRSRRVADRAPPQMSILSYTGIGEEGGGRASIFDEDDDEELRRVLELSRREQETLQRCILGQIQASNGLGGGSASKDVSFSDCEEIDLTMASQNEAQQHVPRKHDLTSRAIKRPRAGSVVDLDGSDDEYKPAPPHKKSTRRESTRDTSSELSTTRRRNSETDTESEDKESADEFSSRSRDLTPDVPLRPKPSLLEKKDTILEPAGNATLSEADIEEKLRRLEERNEDEEKDKCKMSQTERRRRHKEFLASLYALYEINPAAQNSRRKKAVTTYSRKSKPWSCPTTAFKAETPSGDRQPTKSGRITDSSIWDMDDIQEPTPLSSRVANMKAMAYSAPPESRVTDEGAPKRSLKSVLAESTPVPIETRRSFKMRDVEVVIPVRNGKSVQEDPDNDGTDISSKKRNFSQGPGGVMKNDEMYIMKKRRLDEGDIDRKKVNRPGKAPHVEDTQAEEMFVEKAGEGFVEETQMDGLTMDPGHRSATDTTSESMATSMKIPPMELVVEDDEEDDVGRMIISTPGLASLRHKDMRRSGGSGNSSPSVCKESNGKVRTTRRNVDFSSSPLRIPSTVPTSRSSSPDVEEGDMTRGIVAGFTPYPQRVHEKPNPGIRSGLKLGSTPSGISLSKEPVSFRERIERGIRSESVENNSKGAGKRRQPVEFEVEISGDGDGVEDVEDVFFARHGKTGAAKEKNKGKENGQDSSKIQCPLCSNHFAVSEIEEHASGCNGMSSHPSPSPPPENKSEHGESHNLQDAEHDKRKQKLQALSRKRKLKGRKREEEDISEFSSAEETDPDEMAGPNILRYVTREGSASAKGKGVVDPKATRPRKRPKTGGSDASDTVGYEPCPICEVWVLKEELERHIREEIGEDESDGIDVGTGKGITEAAPLEIADSSEGDGYDRPTPHDPSVWTGDVLPNDDEAVQPPADASHHAGHHFVWANQSTLMDENIPFDEEDEDAQLSPLEGFEHLEQGGEGTMEQYKERYRMMGSGRTGGGSRATPARKGVGSGGNSSARKGRGRGGSPWARGRWYKKGASKKMRGASGGRGPRSSNSGAASSAAPSAPGRNYYADDPGFSDRDLQMRWEGVSGVPMVD